MPFIKLKNSYISTELIQTIDTLREGSLGDSVSEKSECISHLKNDAKSIIFFTDSNRFKGVMSEHTVDEIAKLIKEAESNARSKNDFVRIKDAFGDINYILKSNIVSIEEEDEFLAKTKIRAKATIRTQDYEHHDAFVMFETPDQLFEMIFGENTNDVVEDKPNRVVKIKEKKNG